MERLPDARKSRISLHRLIKCGYPFHSRASDSSSRSRCAQVYCTANLSLGDTLSGLG